MNFHWELSWKGHWPVKKQLCEGYVHGAGAKARLYRTPFRAHRARLGVVFRG